LCPAPFEKGFRMAMLTFVVVVIQKCRLRF
jgi:hypothetical protein